jgi:hypothetical protein
MADAPAAIRQVHQVLQQQAIFILEFANKQNLKAIARYLARQQDWNPFRSEPIEFTELNFDFHPRAIRAWLQQAGFEIERQLTVSHFRIDFLKRHAPLSWLVQMDALAQLSGNWWQLSPSVFVRAHAGGNTPPAAPGDFFRCPECMGFPLEVRTQTVVCPSCSRSYAILDGIYDFREALTN